MGKEEDCVEVADLGCVALGGQQVSKRRYWTTPAIVSQESWYGGKQGGGLSPVS